MEEMQKTEEKRYKIESVEEYDKIISEKEQEAAAISKGIGLLAISSLVFLGNALSYNNLLTLIIGSLEIAMAISANFSQSKSNKEIEQLKKEREQLMQISNLIENQDDLKRGGR